MGAGLPSRVTTLSDSPSIAHSASSLLASYSRYSRASSRYLRIRIRRSAPRCVWRVLTIARPHLILPAGAMSQGTALAQALHLYLGPALTPALADLKEIQRDQLSHAFEAMEANGQAGGLGRPSRFTRREQAQREAAEATGTAGQDVAGEPAEFGAGAGEVPG